VATWGDIRTGEAYTSDQFSQVQVASTPLTGNQWVGPAVRAQAGGQDLYVGIYFWDNGNPELMLFLRDNGNWTQLGSGSLVSPLAAGTTLTLTAAASTLSFAENGAVVISANDSTLTGGAPGIIANGMATASNWSGGDSGFQVDYQSTANGVQTYAVISPENGYGVQTLRVLRPTHPAAGVAHNFLFVLPVEAGLGNSYGDGLATLTQWAHPRTWPTAGTAGGCPRPSLLCTRTALASRRGHEAAKGRLRQQNAGPGTVDGRLTFATGERWAAGVTSPPPLAAQALRADHPVPAPHRSM
jgi:hypothetical protein